MTSKVENYTSNRFTVTFCTGSGEYSFIGEGNYNSSILIIGNI